MRISVPCTIAATCAWTEKPLQPMMALAAITLCARVACATLASWAPMVISKVPLIRERARSGSRPMRGSRPSSPAATRSTTPASATMRINTENIMMQPPTKSMELRDSLTASLKSSPKGRPSLRRAVTKASRALAKRWPRTASSGASPEGAARMVAHGKTDDHRAYVVSNCDDQPYVGHAEHADRDRAHHKKRIGCVGKRDRAVRLPPGCTGRPS